MSAGGRRGPSRLRSRLAAEESPGRLLRRGFRGRRRAAAYRHVARGLRSGQPDSLVLRRLWANATDDGRLRPDAVATAYAHWTLRLGSGWTFPASLDGWAPPSHRLVIEAAAGGGDLATGFERAAAFEEASMRMAAGLRAPFLYLGFLAMLLFGVLHGFASFAVPQFSQFLPAEEWKGPGAALASLAGFVTGWGPLALLGGAAAFVWGISWILPRWTGPVRALFERIEPFRTYRAVQGASFLLSLSSLMLAGEKMDSALFRMMRNSDPWLRSKVQAILVRMREGKSLGAAMWLADPGFPDRALLRDLRGAMGFPGFADEMGRMAEDWVESTVGRLSRTGAVVRALGIMAIGGALALIMVGMLSVTRQMQAGLGGGL